ncbi:hypothetical protein AB0O18_33995 [Streptomyces sp. NPDC093224]|uniref:hypothetical protein n=1 Tax=Streptomyces sp. NPDC093224 TaxID=3155198 RepID=UPI00341571EE
MRGRLHLELLQSAGPAAAVKVARREHMSDTVQAVAGLLSHQQTATRGDRQPW